MYVALIQIRNSWRLLSCQKTVDVYQRNERSAIHYCAKNNGGGKDDSPQLYTSPAFSNSFRFRGIQSACTWQKKLGGKCAALCVPCSPSPGSRVWQNAATLIPQMGKLRHKLALSMQKGRVVSRDTAQASGGCHQLGARVPPKTWVWAEVTHLPQAPRWSFRSLEPNGLRVVPVCAVACCWKAG